MTLHIYRCEHPRQRNWRGDEHWHRLMSRDSTIKDPPLPDWVIEQAHEGLAAKVKAIPITR